MKHLVIYLGLISVSLYSGAVAHAEEPTIFFVVRHADRAPDQDDELSEAGSAALAAMGPSADSSLR
jgi:hypothetical protein